MLDFMCNAFLLIFYVWFHSPKELESSLEEEVVRM